MGARRGPNITPSMVYAYKPSGEPHLRNGIWVVTSTHKHLEWHQLRETEQSAIIGSLATMGVSWHALHQAVCGRVEWPHVGTPWSIWIPSNLYKQVLNTQKGARP